MKKENTHKFLYILSALLTIGFIIRLGFDYFKYDQTSNSAPFYALIIERVIEFVIPSIIILIGATYLKKHYK